MVLDESPSLLEFAQVQVEVTGGHWCSLARAVGAIVLLTVGLYLAITALAGFDPIYRLLHWDTCLPRYRDRP